MAQIVVLTHGLWRLRREIAALTGMKVARWDTWPRPAFDAVAGWGYAATAGRARRLARRFGKPYQAFEDGPLRSVRPGPSEPPMSLILDRSGIYYRSSQVSDFLDIVGQPDWFDAAFAARAEAAIAELRRLRLSKYNSGRDLAPTSLSSGGNLVLVLDQVRDDASIAGALADEAAFAAMLDAARADNPDAEIVVKLHPDVLSGRRAGYFSTLVPEARLTLIAEPVNPWRLIDAADAVYTVSSGLGFEAALAAKQVVTFGSPFYAGWGFTDDRRLKVTRPHEASVTEVFAAYYLRYARYFDAYSRQEIPFEAACEQLAWLRDRFLAEPSRAICYRIARWKRGSVARMLDGPAGSALYANTVAGAVTRAKAAGGHVVAWASRDNAKLAAECASNNVPFRRAEDGFVRSAGLGAAFVQPLSLVFDRRGIYYDSEAPSDLEAMLQEGDFSADLVERARRLRAMLVSTRTTKYNVGAKDGEAIDSGGRKIVLVPGQVEDDASIQKGSPRLKRNIDLLRAVRERHPDAFIVYKPHPDVEARLRSGRIAPAEAAELADRVETSGSILALIAACDRVETMTSLAGFEALLRGKQVTTHGQPFYAGWGLTEDLCPVQRRTRRLTLDELVAAALILYPRYIDPLSRRPCPPELLIERLAAAAGDRPRAGRGALRRVQTGLGRALHVVRSARRQRFN